MAATTPHHMNPHVVRALEWMRGSDPAQREKGYDFLREHADAYVDDLIAEFRRSAADEPAAHRELLLELIAEARQPHALPLLAELLGDPDESLQFWAVRGLEMLDTREAQHELDQARAAGLLL